MSFNPNDLAVLNTLTDNGGDCIVDAAGNVNLTGLGSFQASNLTNCVKITAVAEQTQKSNMVFSAENSTDYNWTIQGFDTTSDANVPIPKLVQFTITSDASATTAELSAAATAAINDAGNLSVTATDTGSGVVLLTATAGYPTFTVSETDSNISITAQLSLSFTAAPAGGVTATGIPVVAANGDLSSILMTNFGMGYTTIPTVTFAGGSGTANAGTAVIRDGEVISVTVTGGTSNEMRPGIAAVGTVSKIQFKYGGTTSGGGLTSKPYFPGISDLTSGATYTEWNFDYLNYGDQPNYSIPTNKVGWVLLINNAATASGSDDATFALACLQGQFGTLTGLQAGYRVSISEPATTTADIAADGTVTLAGGAATYLTLGWRPGDTLFVKNAAAFATHFTTTVASISTALIGAGNLFSNETAAVFKYVKWRNLPK